MTTFSKDIVIQASKEDVWKVVADLGKVYKYHLGVNKSYCTTNKEDGLDAARVCELYPDTKIKETVKEWHQGDSYKLRIDPVEKAPPFKDFVAGIKLYSMAPRQTKVTFTGDYQMKLGVLGFILNKLIVQHKMETSIDEMLCGLKIYIEEGKEIKDSEVLKRFLAAA